MNVQLYYHVVCNLVPKFTNYLYYSIAHSLEDSLSVFESEWVARIIVYTIKKNVYITIYIHLGSSLIR